MKSLSLLVEQEQEARFLCKRLAVWQCIFENRVLVLRLVALALLVVIYYSLDWTLLQRLLRSCTIFVLNILGHHTVSINVGSEVFLAVDSELFSISANCTYSDLFLILAPFCWRVGLRSSANTRRLISLAVVILSGNLVRVALALHLYTQGISWILAHTMPSRLIHCAAVAVFVIVTVRSDWQATQT